MLTSLIDTLAYLFFSYLYKKGKLRSSEPEYDLLAQFIKPGDTVIDVGSNIGRYSFKCSKLVGSNGKVISIEPNTRIQRIARLIALKNGIANICFIETCVSDSSGLVTFREDWSAPQSAHFSTATRSRILSQDQLPSSSFKQANRCLSEQGKKPKDLMRFENGGMEKRRGYLSNYRNEARCSEKLCVTLDHLAVKPSLIKIDVEGDEILVLKGGLSTINSCKPIVVVEENEGDYEFLLEIGYIRYKIRGSRNVVFCHDRDARRDAMAGALNRS